MTIPQTLSNMLRQEPDRNLYPLVEVELRGDLSFEALLSVIYDDYKISYRLVKAEVENIDRVSFGKLLLHLNGTSEDNKKVIRYFDDNRIKHTIRGYI